MSRWFLRSLLVGLVSIISVPPLSSGLAWSYAISLLYLHCAVPYHACSFRMFRHYFSFFQEEETMRGGTLFLVYLFRSYVLLVVRLLVIASSSSSTLAGWIEPSCAQIFLFVSGHHAQPSPQLNQILELRFNNIARVARGFESSLELDILEYSTPRSVLWWR